MSSTADLLGALAGIAGIFVGFGALVVLGEDDDATAPELHMVRGVVTIGLLTLVGALVPLGLGGMKDSPTSHAGGSGVVSQEIGALLELLESEYESFMEE